MMGKLATLLTFAGLASAWSPHERDMSASSHGGNLFKGNATEVFDRNGMKRWLPGKLPIRGVNLGSMFIIENWMASTEFKNIGCPNAKSEFDCVLAVGQSTANTNFAKHWNTWITQADIQAMQSYGLNTIRIPVGYWIFKELKYSSEHFPEGQLSNFSSARGYNLRHSIMARLPYLLTTFRATPVPGQNRGVGVGCWILHHHRPSRGTVCPNPRCLHRTIGSPSDYIQPGFLPVQPV